MINSPIASALDASDTLMTDRLCVLFVCTGNTCRSPMAEAYLRSRGGYDVFSRGIAANDGEPVSRLAVTALGEMGIEPTVNNDYPSHTSKTVTLRDMAAADAVVAMTGEHAAALLFTFPQFAGKIRTMREPISDPFGGDLTVYKKTLAELVGCIDSMFPRGAD